jgi:Chromo (CHRromatin Organisation MOdifier) domain
MIADDGTPLYLVDALLKDRQVRRKGRNVKQYLVKWKGYGLDEATWEDESSLSHLDVLKRYKRGDMTPVDWTKEPIRERATALVEEAEAKQLHGTTVRKKFADGKIYSGTLEFVESTFDPYDLEPHYFRVVYSDPTQKEETFTLPGAKQLLRDMESLPSTSAQGPARRRRRA